MRAEELRDLLSRKPFVPIRLFFTDGTVCDGKDPEMALLTRSTVEIGVEEKEGTRIARVPHPSPQAVQPGAKDGALMPIRVVRLDLDRLPKPPDYADSIGDGNRESL